MDRTIRDLLAVLPDADFLIDRESRLSRSACSRIITERVCRLRSNGFSSDDIVAIALAPSTDAVLWILAILEAGLTLFPINLREPRPRIQAQLNELGVSLLLEAETDLPTGQQECPPASNHVPSGRSRKKPVTGSVPSLLIRTNVSTSVGL